MAINNLRSYGGQGIEVLEKRAEALVYDLGSNKFQFREGAYRRLSEMGTLAIKALSQASQSKDKEVRQRAAKLLSEMEIPWQEFADALEKRMEEKRTVFIKPVRLIDAKIESLATDAERKFLAIFANKFGLGDETIGFEKERNEVIGIYKGILSRIGFSAAAAKETKQGFGPFVRSPLENRIGEVQSISISPNGVLTYFRGESIRPQDLFPDGRLVNSKNLNEIPSFTYESAEWRWGSGVPEFLDSSASFAYLRSLYPSHAEEIERRLRVPWANTVH